MRVKIQEVILRYISASNAQMIHSHDDVFLTDKVLTLISEEIEKMENPVKGNRFQGSYQDGGFEGFEACRQEILNLLRPKENVVGSVEL